MKTFIASFFAFHVAFKALVAFISFDALFISHVDSVGRLFLIFFNLIASGIYTGIIYETKK